MKDHLLMVYIQVYFSECEKKERFNVQMEIICDKKTNENMHDRVLCSEVVFIIQYIARNIPNKR